MEFWLGADISDTSFRIFCLYFARKCTGCVGPYFAEKVSWFAVCPTSTVGNAVPGVPREAQNRFSRGEAVMEIAQSDFHD
jgi:hypothetical protein